MTRFMEYCIQDSELVNDLMNKLDVWTSLVEMASIMGITISDITTRGQQIRCLSLLYDAAATNGYVIDSRDVPGYGFAGGSVKEHVAGVQENIICYDF